MVRDQLYVSSLLPHGMAYRSRAHPGSTVWSGLCVYCLTRSGVHDTCEDEFGAFPSIAETKIAKRSCGKQALTSWALLISFVSHLATEKQRE